MKEIWSKVPFDGFAERYMVSNLGRVKPTVISKYSSTKSEFLKPANNPGGYQFVLLYCNGKRIEPFIHRMVAMVFLDPPSEGVNIVRHLDGNRANNVVTNLSWGTNYENMQDMIQHGHSMFGSRNIKAKLTDQDIIDIRLMYESGGISQALIAARYGIDQTQVSRIVRGLHWKHITK